MSKFINNALSNADDFNCQDVQIFVVQSTLCLQMSKITESQNQ